MMRSAARLALAMASAGTVALVAASTAHAEVYNGRDCNYAKSQDVSLWGTPSDVGQVYVYEGSGMTGTAAASAGACANLKPVPASVVTVEGGAVEAGASPTYGRDPVSGAYGGPGVYAVADGDNDNRGGGGFVPQPGSYFGVSNYDTCGGASTCYGSNPGGSFDQVSRFYYPLPLMLVCDGGSGGRTWSHDHDNGCTTGRGMFD
jgi:hypothetical protein